MLTAQELGWLVVLSSMVLGITFCLGVCLALWCRKLSGGRNKMSPVTMLDPSDKKNGLPPSKASLLLPSVTRSEFSSEPRTLSSSTTLTSSYPPSHWSVGKAMPRPYHPTHASRFQDHLPPEPIMRGLYLPYPLDFPPKYATMFSTSSSDAHRDHLAQLTAHWTRSRQGQQLDAKVPMVPTTLTYMPQPRSDQLSSPVNSSDSIRQFGQESKSDKDVGSGSSANRSGVSGRRRLGSERGGTGCESAPNVDVSGIDGRRQLVSGLGYSDPEFLNSYDDEGVVPSAYRSRSSMKKKVATRHSLLKRQVRDLHRQPDGDVPDSRSPILGGTNVRSQYGADRNTEMTLSTGVNIGHVPIVSSSTQIAQRRESSKSRKFNEGVHRSSSGSENVMENLGIATKVQNEPTVKEIMDAKAKANRQGRGNSRTSSEPPKRDGEAAGSERGPGRASVPLMQIGSGGLDERAADNLGSLGGIEIKVKYQAVQQQLIMTIISALHLPARFHSAESKLYVKIMIGTGTRYTTPAVPGAPHPSFCCTLVHRVHSTRLQRTHIRLSVCQLDPQERRIVVGFASLSPPDLWPLLHLPPAPLTHDLSPRHLLLSLQDTAPQHQLDCGGNVTLGLTCDARAGRITVASVTLQDVRSTSGLTDFGHSQVYLKATVFRGREMICWRRSSPVVLNRQRTHLVHQLMLRVHDPQDEACRGMTSSAGQHSLNSAHQNEQPCSRILQLSQQNASSVVDALQKVGECLPQGTVSNGSFITTEYASTTKSVSPKMNEKFSNVNADKQSSLERKMETTQISYLKKKTDEQQGDLDVRMSSPVERSLALRRDHESVSSDESTPSLCRSVYPCMEIKEPSLKFDLTEKVESIPRKKKEASDSMVDDGQIPLTEYINNIFENNLRKEWTDLPAGEDEPKNNSSKIVNKNVGLSFTEMIHSSSQSNSLQYAPVAKHNLNVKVNEMSNISSKHEPTKPTSIQINVEGGTMSVLYPDESLGSKDALRSETEKLQCKVDAGDATSPEGATVERPTRARLQHQASTEDEASNDAVLLVLSVRLKTPKRGGRCVLGTVQLGEMASTEQGRSHWRRALASTLVPAAGTHELSH